MNADEIFYSIINDIKSHPDAWCFLTVGGRGTGKTYGALKDCLVNKRKFVFVKRCADDVELLCTGGNGYVEADFSPFKAINRDMGSNIKAVMIKNPVAGFYHCNEDGEPEGAPIGYIVPLSLVKKVKGFDLSECDWLIFDEFIPEQWERISRSEGEQLLELYMTINRAREIIGKPPLILIGLANAVDISNPVMYTLEVTDYFARMNAANESSYYEEDRGIFCRMLNDNAAFRERMQETKIYKAMAHTAWGQMAFNNQFSHNDFTNVKKKNLKNYKPVTSFLYKRKKYYIYMKDGEYYITYSPYQKDTVYDLGKENDQKKFYLDYVIDLRAECIDDRMRFETFTMYDLIVNYKKFFKI